MWQELKDNVSGASNHRLNIPGEWIIRTIVKYYHSTSDGAGEGSAVEQTFVSDPNYQWKLEA